MGMVTVIRNGQAISVPEATLNLPTEKQPVIDESAFLTFLEFLNLLTHEEKVAIISSTDVNVRLFIMMATGATLIDLAFQDTINGVHYMVSQGLLTPARGEEILAYRKTP